MNIDCGKCPIREVGCSDCVVNLFWEAPTTGLGLWPAERRALELLAEAGLIARITSREQFQIELSESA